MHEGRTIAAPVGWRVIAGNHLELPSRTTYLKSSRTTWNRQEPYRTNYLKHAKTHLKPSINTLNHLGLARITLNNQEEPRTNLSEILLNNYLLETSQYYTIYTVLPARLSVNRPNMVSRLWFAQKWVRALKLHPFGHQYSYSLTRVKEVNPYSC